MVFYNFIGFYTLFKRESMRYIKIYGQTIFAPLLSNMLFLWVFWSLFQTRSVWIEWVGYLEFLVPWLCIMWAILSAYQNPSSSLIIQKYQNILEDLNTFPISSFEKAFAYTLAWAVRGLLIWFLTYVATIYFVWYHIELPLLFFFSIFLVSFIFSALWVITGLYLPNFDRISFVLNIIITPLVYFGWVFFEISKLPWILSNLIYINPIFPMIDLVRYAYLWSSEWNLFFNITTICLLCIITFWQSWYMFRRGVWLKT